LKSIGVTIKDNTIAKLANINVKPYTCPSKCTTRPDTNISSDLLGIGTPTLNIDPQNNVWKYGDIPNGGYSNSVNIQDFYTKPTNIKNYYDNNNQPQPESAFGTTYPFTTYYKCDWLGPNNSNSGLPNNDISTQFTTIPCSYRPNYQETGRYICKTDPNTSGISSCDNVSIIS